MSEWTMTQSAIILDISDSEETKACAKTDRGKENVDPNEISVPVTRSMAAAKAAEPSVAQKETMSDGARSPLSDLNPSDYFGEGLDAASVVLVDDNAEKTVEDETAMGQPIHKQTPGKVRAPRMKVRTR